MGCMAAGISCFDGRKFTNYSTSDGLVSNNVRVVWYSKMHDLIMVSSNEGCSALQQGKFTNFTRHDLKPDAIHFVTTGFFENKQSVYICAYNDLPILEYKPIPKKYLRPAGFKHFESPSSSPIFLRNGDTVTGAFRDMFLVLGKNCVRRFADVGQIFGLSVDDRDRVWIAGWSDPIDGATLNSGLFRYDGSKVVPFGRKMGITDQSVWTVFYDTDVHVLWVGTLNQGLFMVPEPVVNLYDPGYFELPSLKINDLVFDRQGKLWIAADSDIVRLDVSGGFKIFDKTMLHNLRNRTVKVTSADYWKFLLDKDGSFEKYDRLIRQRRYHYCNPYLEINTEYGGIRKYKSKERYNPDQFKKTIASLNTRNYPPKICYSSSNSDTAGNILISSGPVLFTFDPLQDQQPPKAEFLFFNATVFAVDKTDTMYSGCLWHNGVFYAALHPGISYPVKPYYEWLEEKGPPKVTVMVANGSEIWCGSKTEGLFRIADGKVDAYNLKDPTLPRIITALCFDRRGNVVAGGVNGNVIVGRTEGRNLKVLHSLTEKDGLIGNTITWLQVDSANRLYVGTNKGINLIDLDELYKTGTIHLRFFNEEDGYPDYSGKTARIDQHQNLWIGTPRGLIRCDSKLFTGMARLPVVRINGLDIHDQPFQFPEEVKPDIWTGSPVEHWRFRHDQNSMTFYFAMTGYSNAEHHKYRYRLDGLTKEWSKLSTDGKAVFTNLDPGSYLLMVEGYDVSDNQAISRTTYHFSIASPWYRTWWFYLMIMVLFIFVMRSVYQWRIRRIKQRENDKNKVLVEMSKLEMKALQAQMKPHFIFNAINSMQSYILKNDIDNALYYLNMFSKLIRKTLENASKEFIPLVEELDYLRYYIEIEKMRFEGLFEYRIIIPEDVSVETVMIPPMIVQLFVENAIKHGLTHLDSGGLLTVELLVKGTGQYCIVVEDNGVGMVRSSGLEQQSHTHKSFGLQIVRERIRILNECHGMDAFNLTITHCSHPDGTPAGVRVEFVFTQVAGV